MLSSLPLPSKTKLLVLLYCLLTWDHVALLPCHHGSMKKDSMAMIVSFVSQKGGVYKSTLARLLAREFAAQDWTVKIADLDISQGTCFQWRAQRLERQIEP